jgi:pimeloyl-ACP methyl ester carboxylesterase
MLILSLILLVLTGCKKNIAFGQRPMVLDKDIKYEKGSVHFNEDNLDVKYIVVRDHLRKDSDDGIVFYLHGFNRTEYEWVEDGGFGSLFYRTLKSNPDLKSYTVVSISLGGIFVFVDGAPSPYNADLEKMFFDRIVPYFREKLSKKDGIYLVGHSLGGYNSLTLALRHPDSISAIAVISPYVAPISPFTTRFDEKGKELKMTGFQIKMLKSLLTGAYSTEEKWDSYNPFMLAQTADKFPFISVSDAKNDLPGFEWSIDNFNAILEKKGARHSYCKSEGDHNSTCDDFFSDFLFTLSSLN